MVRLNRGGLLFCNQTQTIVVIYIDQPIGTGFSFGTVDVNSTFAAAPAIWTAFQVLFESEDFAKFKSRE